MNALESHQAMSINGLSYARGVAGLPLPAEDCRINSERSFTFDNRQALAPTQDSQHRTQSEAIATMQTKFVLTSKLKTSDPFDGKEFYTWSFKLKLLATTAQIWMYYDGSLLFPTKGTIQEKNRYYHESLLAYTTLLRNLSPSEQLGICPYKSEWAPAYASWEHLRNSYMATNPVAMSLLLSQLTSVKMQQGEKAGPYIKRCHNLRDHIKKCGGTVPDDMFVSMVLSGLGPDWCQCQSLLRAQATISESALCATLLSEQKEIDLYNEKNNKWEKLVFFTGATEGEQHGKKGTFCKYCKKPGHTIDRCYKRKAADERRNNSSSQQPSTPSASPAATLTLSPPSVVNTSQNPACISNRDKGKGSVMSRMARRRRGIRYYDDIEYPPIAPLNPIRPSPKNDPTLSSWTNQPTDIPPDFELPPSTPESPPSLPARRYIDLSQFTGNFDRIITPKIAGIARRNRENYNTWYLDSCCGQHMVGSPKFISESKHMRRPCKITAASNNRLKAYEIGEIYLEAEDIHLTIHIEDVLVVPNLQYNLLSSAQLMRCGVDIRRNCEDNTFELFYKNTYIGKAVDDNGVFVLNLTAEGTTGDSERTLLLKTTPTEAPTWSHLDEMDLERPASDGLLRLRAVPTASTSNPGDTGPATMEEDENNRGSATAEADIGGWGTTPAAGTGWGNLAPTIGPWGVIEPPQTTAGGGWGTFQVPEEEAEGTTGEAA
ncbi:unnamed protein product [Closterium sp. NIES-53]